MLAYKTMKENLKSKTTTVFEIKYEDVRKQKEITTLYMELFQIKKKLENNSQEAPSSNTLELTMDFDLHCRIDNSLSGK